MNKIAQLLLLTLLIIGGIILAIPAAILTSLGYDIDAAANRLSGYDIAAKPTTTRPTTAMSSPSETTKNGRTASTTTIGMP